MAKIPAVKGYTKKQVKAFLNYKLRTDLKWAKHACKTIYNLQKPAEKRSDISNGQDGIGFNKHDATDMSGIARKIINRRTLKSSEVAKLFHRMPRYASQIASVCDTEKLRKNLAHHYN